MGWLEVRTIFYTERVKIVLKHKDTSRTDHFRIEVRKDLQDTVVLAAFLLAGLCPEGNLDVAAIVVASSGGLFVMLELKRKTFT